MAPPKRVLVVRHGESEWNVLRSKYPASKDRFSPNLYAPDCGVTQLGKEQSRKAGMCLRNILSSLGDGGGGGKKNDTFTLIVSPLRRALQTAQGILEELRRQEEASTTTNCHQPSSTTIVHPGAAEVLADSCDIGTDTNQLEQEFPDFSFDLLSRPHWWAFGRSQEETWERMRCEQPGGSETEEMVLERFRALRKFVETLSDDTVVIVCHSETIWWLTSRVASNGERFGTWTKNGEVVDVSLEFLGAD